MKFLFLVYSHCVLAAISSVEGTASEDKTVAGSTCCAASVQLGNNTPQATANSSANVSLNGVKRTHSPDLNSLAFDSAQHQQLGLAAAAAAAATNSQSSLALNQSLQQLQQLAAAQQLVQSQSLGYYDPLLTTLNAKRLRLATPTVPGLAGQTLLMAASSPLRPLIQNTSLPTSSEQQQAAVQSYMTSKQNDQLAKVNFNLKFDTPKISA